MSSSNLHRSSSDESSMERDHTSSDRPCLILDRGNSFNTVLNCDALGIHYEVSTPESVMHTKRVSTISKWDARLNKNVPVAEWERYSFKGDTIKMEALGARDFVPLKEVFPRTWGLPYDETFNRSFTAPNGKRYTWKSRAFSMKLYCEEGGNKTLIAAYHRSRHVIKSRKPFIELYDGYEDIIDLLVVTCMVVVARRKEGETQVEP